jgi:peptide/nickel transport system permease protein
LKLITKFFLIVIGFILISALPSLLYKEVKEGYRIFYEFDISFLEYFKNVYQHVVLLFQPESWIFRIRGGLKEYPLFPMLWDRYFYTMSVFAISLGIALLVAYLLMIFLHILPIKIKKLFISLFTIIESLPDVFIIISLQVFIILYYKKTGVLLAQIAVFQEDIYLLPVMCLSIIPLFLLLKTMLFFIKEEQSKMYVDLAKVKGLSDFRILLIHTFRNVLYSLFYRSKLIFSFMLSNLFIIEVLFNMNGAMQFLIPARGAEFIITAILLFIPFFVFFSATEKFILQYIGESEELV